MHTSSSCAKEYPSIHSMRNGCSPLGILSNSTAAAPSDNIQRKKSLLKAIIGCSSSCFKFSTSLLKWSAIIQEDILSDPVQIALLVLPERTDRKPNFNAFIPAQQFPAAELTSIFRFPSPPGTITACDGIR